MKSSIHYSFVLAFCAVLAGCVTGPKYKLVKNVSDQELQQDNAACQNQAQMIQVADWEFKGTFMEGANIQMKRNRAFENCLVAKGYAAQAVDPSPVDRAYIDQIKSIDSAVDDLCDRSEYQPIVQKTPCGIGLKQPTMEMLTDKTKITKQQRALLDRFSAERSVLIDQKKALTRSNGSNNSKTYLQKYETVIEPALLMNNAELWEGKISWGQYNKEILRLYGVNATLKQ